MKAENKTIKKWFSELEHDEILVPSYQRNYVWSRRSAHQYLNALLKKIHPLGVFLLHHNDPLEKDKTFHLYSISREATFRPSQGDRYQLLLDGRQRLTTLWNYLSVKNQNSLCFFTYKNHNNEINFKDIGGFEIQVISTLEYKKRINESKKSDNRSELAMCAFPLHFLSPDLDACERIRTWVGMENLQKSDQDRLKDGINSLRTDILSKEIPFFLLPQTISRKNAINIFIRTNISSVKLTSFEIKCSEMEIYGDQNLRIFVKDIMSKLGEKFKMIYHSKNRNEDEQVNNTGDLILKITSVLRGDRPRDSYSDLEKESEEIEKNLGLIDLISHQKKITRGIKWTTAQMNDLRINEFHQLPSTIPFKVVPVIVDELPLKGEVRMHAKKMIIVYIWRSFLSDRYTKYANERLLIDCKILAQSFKAIKDPSPNQYFSNQYLESLLPEGMNAITDLKKLKWPSRGSMHSRAITLACIQGGAKDLITNDNLLNSTDETDVELHHIFPKKPLENIGVDADLALNAMYLCSKTNKEWGSSLPGDYLRGKYKDRNTELQTELEAFCIPYEIIMDATAEKFQHNPDGLRRLYEDFLTKREILINKKITKLTSIA